MSSINLPSPRGGSNLTPSLSTIIVGVVVILAGALFFAIIVPGIMPVQASTQAQQIDQLFTFLMFVGGAVFMLVQGVLLYAVVRYRARPGDLADGPPVHGNTMIEAVWTAIPAVIVAVLAIYSVVVWNNTHAVAPNEKIVNSVGARFAWTFNYTVDRETLPTGLNFDQLKPEIQADLTDEDGIISFSSPMLYTWVGQPVAVRMTATDVNHAFWVPTMRVKQDVLVGRTTEVRFTPTMAGSFRIVCAELCGSGHGNMAGEIGADGELLGSWVIVFENEEEYLAQFYNPEATSVVLPPDDPALLGRQILASGAYPCAACHVLDDLGWAGAVGPNLNGIGDRADARAAQAGDADGAAYLVHSIRAPGDWLVPGFGNLMPQFNPDPGQANYMPDSDLNAIVAYLLSQTSGS
ncbi:MAG: cytochrome c oxidase subunit II [Chloroflexota bacterium]|nr:cytochrome c oxidase subunit II [Chloroflexota bacterium]